MDSQRLWSPRPSPDHGGATGSVLPSRAKREASPIRPSARPVNAEQWSFGHMPVVAASAGGRAEVSRGLRPLFLQPKLEVGAVDSPLEREADQVAAQVMRAPVSDGAPAGDAAGVAEPGNGSGQVQRKCDGCKNEDEENKVSRVPAGASASAFDKVTAPGIVHQALQSPGQPLDPAAHRFMQSRLGHDFSRVRIHSDESAAQSAAAIHARAYTVGESVVFARNQYAPDTEAGRSLLAHELVHVMQQSDARPGRGVATEARGKASSENRGEAAADRPRGVANRAVVQRTPSQLPEITLGGHSIAGDRRDVDRLLEGQLTVGRYLQPTYLGSPMTLEAVADLLRSIAPTLTVGELRGHVQFQWNQKLAATPRLPALYDSPVTVSLNPDAPSTAAGGGAGSAGAGGAGTTGTPSPQSSGLPDMAGGSSPQGPSGAGGGGTWSPSLGPQVTVNLVRGSGPPTDSAMQRQYAMGDNVQVLFQDSNDSGTGAYQVLAGGQAATPNLIHSSIVKLQPFIQLVAGFSEVPGVSSATMLVQVSFGAQVSFVFGPVTLQLSAAIQQTAQQGQSLQSAAAFSATLGPTEPQGNTGTQQAGRWSIGIGPPPPLPGPAGGPSGYPPAGGGMVYGGFTF